MRKDSSLQHFSCREPQAVRLRQKNVGEWASEGEPKNFVGFDGRQPLFCTTYNVRMRDFSLNSGGTAIYRPDAFLRRGFLFKELSERKEK